ncbi:hypothetical protein [Streptomyces sp. NPDC054829]
MTRARRMLTLLVTATVLLYLSLQQGRKRRRAHSLASASSTLLRGD